MALTVRQQRFVDEYMIDLNATQAAIRAGYSAKTAYSHGQRLLKNVEVAATLSERSQKNTSALDLSAERVLRGLLEEATRTGEGSSHGARVSAWGLLGKYHKLFTDRIEAEVSGDITVTDARTKLQSLLSRQLAGSAAKRDSSGTD